MEAGLKLFTEEGFQKTSIARIETEAGLRPRAGAFYRHFDGKEALLLEIARTYVTEAPEDFSPERLRAFGDTRAELVAIALRYEEAMVRQKPFARLIEEIRLLDFGAEFENELNQDMIAILGAWISDKPAVQKLSQQQTGALLVSIIRGWLFYIHQIQKVSADLLDRDTMLDEWARHWAQVLDTSK